MREETIAGNAAEMREVLKPWIAFAEWLLENAGKEKLGEAIRENGPIIRQRLEELRAALAAPPRNCDVGTVKEQADRHRAYCREHYTPDSVGGNCRQCPLKDIRGWSCQLAWAQMPYASEAAKPEPKGVSC